MGDSISYRTTALPSGTFYLVSVTLAIPLIAVDQAADALEPLLLLYEDLQLTG